MPIGFRISIGYPSDMIKEAGSGRCPVGTTLGSCRMAAGLGWQGRSRAVQGGAPCSRGSEQGGCLGRNMGMGLAHGGGHGMSGARQRRDAAQGAREDQVAGSGSAT
jgi:hypothetical protein